MAVTGPRQPVMPFRPIPLEVPEGMTANEFFNSAENLDDLVNRNGLLTNPGNLVLCRKALGHTNEFDTSILQNTWQCTLDPLGGPVRRTEVPLVAKRVCQRRTGLLPRACLDADIRSRRPGSSGLRRLCRPILGHRTQLSLIGRYRGKAYDPRLSLAGFTPACPTVDCRHCKPLPNTARSPKRPMRCA